MGLTRSWRGFDQCAEFKKSFVEVGGIKAVCKEKYECDPNI